MALGSTLGLAGDEVAASATGASPKKFELSEAAAGDGAVGAVCGGGAMRAEEAGAAAEGAADLASFASPTDGRGAPAAALKGLRSTLPLSALGNCQSCG
jgi:hypothetical protein